MSLLISVIFVFSNSAYSERQPYVERLHSLPVGVLTALLPAISLLGVEAIMEDYRFVVVINDACSGALFTSDS